MEAADDALVSKLVDIADLNVEEILAVDGGPLAECIRRLIIQSGQSGSMIASFESFIGEESTDVA